MHLAIIAPPTPGHLNPLGALAVELDRLGHRATFVHLSDVDRSSPVVAGRFEALPAAVAPPGTLGDYLAILGRADGWWGRRRMIAATADVTARLLAGLPGVLERIGAEAVVADSAEPAGGLVARHLRLPFVTTVTGLPLLRDAGVPPPFVGWPYRAGWLGRARNAGGYAVADRLLRPITRTVAGQADRWRLKPDGGEGFSPLLQVAQCPQALDFPRDDLPACFRYGAPWRLPEPAVDLPDDGRPLIFCSLGTLQGARRSLFAIMTAACAAVGARAVVAHGGGLSAEEAAALPGEPLVRDFWPQRAVLRRCAAAVLHGGFNTVLDALAAGVPIVALPIAFEQPATAARLVRSGAGETVRLAKAEGALAPALRRVLTQAGYRAAAGQLAATMATDGAARAATLIDRSLRDEPGPGERAAAATTASPGSDDAHGGSRRNGSR